GNVTLAAIAVTDSDIASAVCTIDTLAPGANTTCSAGSTAVAGQYQNMGTATGSGPQGQPAIDVDPSHYLGLLPGIDVRIDIAKDFAGDEQETVIAGGAASSFTLDVTNNGIVPLSNVLVTDTVNSLLGVTDVAVTTASAAGGEDCSASSGQNVSCFIPTLAVNESVTITVDFAVDSSVPAMSDVLNTGNATGDYTDDSGNSITVNAEASDTIDIRTDIDLSIDKTFVPTEVPQGNMGRFTLVVSNTGPSDAVNVSVTDTVNDLLKVLEINGVRVTSGNGDCSASAGQDVNCTVQIPAGQSVTVTVDYTAGPFLSSDPAAYGTQAGDDFYFQFVNGSVLYGSTDTVNGDGVFLISPDGTTVQDITADVEIRTSLTRNDLIVDLDGAGPDPAFEMHLSCSDPFTGGWGQSAGPVEGVDVNWQIAFFSIARYNSGNGFIKNCGNVLIPFDVPNTGTASGEDSNGTETVSDDATLTIVPGVTLDRLQTNGKRVTARLINFTGEEKEILDVQILWPGNPGPGNLTKVRLNNPVVWSDRSGLSSEDPDLLILDANDSGWLGGTLLATQEPQILRFDFQKKTAGFAYRVRINFEGGTFLDLSLEL
ncbi:MAG: hypothetical protein ACR2QU_03575, partial [Gammaproteobacteria bacterium]